MRLQHQVCPICHEKKPVSSVAVRKNERIVTHVCSEHTLREVVFFNRQGDEKIVVNLTLEKND